MPKVNFAFNGYLDESGRLPYDGATKDVPAGDYILPLSTDEDPWNISHYPYAFLGWYDSSEDTELYQPGDSFNLTKDTSFLPKWQVYNMVSFPRRELIGFDPDTRIPVYGDYIYPDGNPIDLRPLTVTKETLAQDKTAYDRTGIKIGGSMDVQTYIDYIERNPNTINSLTIQEASIKAYAIDGLVGLKEIHMELPEGSSKIDIDSWAFVGCDTLTDIWIPWPEPAIPGSDGSPWGADATVVLHYSGSAEYYDGPYDVFPMPTDIDLETEGKMCSDDITVEPIPYVEIENEAGGLTINIACDDV
ncbi:MAG: hypothetical protein HUJ78_00015 [Mogibacterium sp.]|nr:hypothetical protein [Mogibacterium sp.]